jgi:hypothetical protein
MQGPYDSGTRHSPHDIVLDADTVEQLEGRNGVDTATQALQQTFVGASASCNFSSSWVWTVVGSGWLRGRIYITNQRI